MDAPPSKSERSSLSGLPTAGGFASPSLESSSEHGRFLPGTLFGRRFRIVGLLGRGGMSEVYRADDLELGQSVALKFLPQRVSADSGELALLRNEVRLARQVSHPNVCRVYDIGEAEGLHFLSMEYVDGEDLASILRRLGRPSKEKAIQMARQICAGLAAAHELGVLHRDLKPANIMIDGRGRVRITDFGLATLAREAARSSSRAGTPAYMAPEQLAGREISSRSDIYALGLVLYEIFTGERAFPAGSLAELVRQQESGVDKAPAQLVPDLDAGIEQVILQCLEHDPRLRPGGVLGVAAALPGGDALSEALAAGETPSPEMVAAAGGTSGVAPWQSVLTLLGFLAGLVLLVWLAESVTLPRLAPPTKPPEAMADRARELLKQTGLAAQPRDSASGYFVDFEYLDQIRRKDATPQRWERLRSGRPTAYNFWYRESPQWMVPLNPLGQVMWEDPAPIYSGMAFVVLDAEGRLRWLEVIAPQMEEAPPGESQPDFSKLLSAAQFEEAQLTPVPPKWVPQGYADERRAWEGHYPGAPDHKLRIEAAAYRGRPTYFQVVDDFRAAWRMPQPDQSTALGRFAAVMRVGMYLLALISSLLVARVNRRLGRGDQRGAVRIGVFSAMLALAGWGLAAHYTMNAPLQLSLFAVPLAASLLVGFWLGCAYLAFEPYVRRLLPNVLISWTRLLLGQVRDPRVGRDILAGGVAALLCHISMYLSYLVPQWLGFPPRMPFWPQNLSLGSGREALAIFSEFSFLLSSLLMALLLTGVLFIVKRRGPAIVLTVLILSAVDFGWFAEQGALALWLQELFAVSVLMFVLVRFGLLALVAACFLIVRLGYFPLTLDLSAWYADRTVLVLAVFILLAVYAFRISLGNRPLVRDDLTPSR